MATESVKTSAVEEEEGLPSPPLDEGIFFATPTSMELSQVPYLPFFWGGGGCQSRRNAKCFACGLTYFCLSHVLQLQFI